MTTDPVPRMRAMSVWAKNRGGHGGDSAADVRATRNADQESDATTEQRIAARVAAEARSEVQIASGLFTTDEFT
ncbi:hypothetical protein [Actinotalea sp. C106]|uniref:hypothetical protein n=1 Tax=Actinotalea sp. C106 TaxID=2908644 RepID=UPI00202949F6|nr:hypothetical protein [Actinotalea sp. C106]